MRLGMFVAIACLVVATQTACQRAGPESDAARALASGDQRVLALISVDPEGSTAWATVGLSCRDTQVVPLRKVGRSLQDGDRYRVYVTKYNEALSASRRYRYRAHCGPRSRFPDGIGRAVR